MKFYISCSQFLLESKLNVYMFMAVMYPSHFCRVRVTSPSIQSNLKIFCAVRISANVSWFRVYSDKKSEKLFFFHFSKLESTLLLKYRNLVQVLRLSYHFRY